MRRGEEIICKYPVVSGQLAGLRFVVFHASEIGCGGLGLIVSHISESKCGSPAVAAAAARGVSRPALSSLLNGKAGLSGDMALRIEKAFGVKTDTLMRMQSAYEIAQTRKREKQIRVQRVGCAA